MLVNAIISLIVKVLLKYFTFSENNFQANLLIMNQPSIASNCKQSVICVKMHSQDQPAKIFTYFSSCKGKKITSQFILSVDRAT